MIVLGVTVFISVVLVLLATSVVMMCLWVRKPVNTKKNIVVVSGHTDVDGMCEGAKNSPTHVLEDRKVH